MDCLYNQSSNPCTRLLSPAKNNIKLNFSSQSKLPFKMYNTCPIFCDASLDCKDGRLQAFTVHLCTSALPQPQIGWAGSHQHEWKIVCAVCNREVGNTGCGLNCTLFFIYFFSYFLLIFLHLKFFYIIFFIFIFVENVCFFLYFSLFFFSFSVFKQIQNPQDPESGSEVWQVQKWSFGVRAHLWFRVIWNLILLHIFSSLIAYDCLSVGVHDFKTIFCII